MHVELGRLLQQPVTTGLQLRPMLDFFVFMKAVTPITCAVDIIMNLVIHLIN